MNILKELVVKISELLDVKSYLTFRRLCKRLYVQSSFIQGSKPNLKSRLAIIYNEGEDFRVNRRLRYNHFDFYMAYGLRFNKNIGEIKIDYISNKDYFDDMYLYIGT